MVRYNNTYSPLRGNIDIFRKILHISTIMESRHTRGQLFNSADISEGINTGDDSLLVVVSNDVSLLVGGDAGVINSELLEERLTTDGPEDGVVLCGGVVVVGGVGEGDSLVVGLGEGGDAAVGDYVDADVGHLVAEGILDNGVE